ncbi:MAG: DUF2905 domain-containing protein [Candidatus Eisenbacteria bacterium]|nr:DUF2905 domain-containing protein [Candidatus Eisenbacteria bacterium]
MDRSLSRLLILAGLFLVVLGLAVRVAPKIPWIGRLPGDLRISKPGFTLYLPIVTCLLLSLLLTLLLSFWNRR